MTTVPSVPAIAGQIAHMVKPDTVMQVLICVLCVLLFICGKNPASPAVADPELFSLRAVILAVYSARIMTYHICTTGERLLPGKGL